MAQLDLSDLAINPKSLRAAIKELEDAIEKQTRMREHLEAILAFQGGVSKPRRGRPAKASKKATKKSTAKRARGGKTLREAIVAVLKRSKSPLKAKEIRDRVLASGYETSATAKSFYVSVFTTATTAPGVKKTKAGFALK